MIINMSIFFTCTLVIFSTVLADTIRAPSATRPPSTRASRATRASTTSTERGKLSSDPRIVGGNPAPKGKYPFFVNTVPPSKLCGGTLIAPEVVLTAAHCKGYFKSGVNVGATLVDGSIDVETFEVVRELPHTNFNSESRENDIMLVKLKKKITINSVVELNFDKTIPVEDDKVTVIGFGRTELGKESKILLNVDIRVYNDTFCDDLYEDFFPETMMCAGTKDGGRDSCQGDSGGPLLTPTNVQVGIVSSGDGCGEPNVPGIYTEISAFESFILEGIQTLSVGMPTPNPINSPIVVPVHQPIDNPVVPPVDSPIVPPVDSPIVPPVDSPIVPPFDSPVVSPADSPVVPPVDSPVVPPVDGPVVAPNFSPVVSPPTTGKGDGMMMMGDGDGMMMMMGKGRGMMMMMMMRGGMMGMGQCGGNGHR